MSRPSKRLVRRVELVERMRSPAPLEYDHTPHNRAQRRLLARALRAAKNWTPPR